MVSCVVAAWLAMSSGAPMRLKGTDATLLAVIACWIAAGRKGSPLKIVKFLSKAAPGSGFGNSPPKFSCGEVGLAVHELTENAELIVEVVLDVGERVLAAESGVML